MWVCSIARARTSLESSCPTDLPHERQRAKAGDQEEHAAQPVQDRKTLHLARNPGLMHQGSEHDFAHDRRCCAYADQHGHCASMVRPNRRSGQRKEHDTDTQPTPRSDRKEVTDDLAGRLTSQQSEQ